MIFKVKEYREQKKMTQAELSKASGIGRITISRMESGALKETSAGTLLKIANALGCSMQDLVVSSDAAKL